MRTGGIFREARSKSLKVTEAAELLEFFGAQGLGGFRIRGQTRLLYRCSPLLESGSETADDFRVSGCKVLLVQRIQFFVIQLEFPQAGLLSCPSGVVHQSPAVVKNSERLRIRP